LITGTKLHEGQPQRCFRALFAVEGEGGEAVALPDAAGEALGEKTSTGMRRHGTRSSARAAMRAVRYSPRSRNWETATGVQAWQVAELGSVPVEAHGQRVIKAAPIYLHTDGWSGYNRLAQSG